MELHTSSLLISWDSASSDIQRFLPDASTPTEISSPSTYVPKRIWNRDTYLRLSIILYQSDLFRTYFSSTRKILSRAETRSWLSWHP